MPESDFIHVKCPQCDVGYKINKSMIPPEGRTGRCKKCQAKIVIRLKPQNQNSSNQVPTEVIKYCPTCKRKQNAGNQCYVCGGQLKSKRVPIKQENSTRSVAAQSGQQSGATGIQITAKFFPLMWILFFVRPKFEVDGEIYQGDWKKTMFIPTTPGQHHVKIYFPYFFLPYAGANELEVFTESGEIPDVWYNFNIPFIFAKGEIKVNSILKVSSTHITGPIPSDAPSEPWYKTKSALIWMMILLFWAWPTWPIQLFLFWRSKHFTKRTKITVTVVYILIGIGMLNS